MPVLSTFSVGRTNAGAAMWSAIWKYCHSAPEAPDEDVLTFSPDRPRVFLLIYEPGTGSCPACQLTSSLKGLQA